MSLVTEQFTANPWAPDGVMTGWAVAQPDKDMTAAKTTANGTTAETTLMFATIFPFFK